MAHIQVYKQGWVSCAGETWEDEVAFGKLHDHFFSQALLVCYHLSGRVQVALFCSVNMQTCSMRSRIPAAEVLWH